MTAVLLPHGSHIHGVGFSLALRTASGLVLASSITLTASYFGYTNSYRDNHIQFSVLDPGFEGHITIMQSREHTPEADDQIEAGFTKSYSFSVKCRPKCHPQQILNAQALCLDLTCDFSTSGHFSTSLHRHFSRQRGTGNERSELTQNSLS